MKLLGAVFVLLTWLAVDLVRMKLMPPRVPPEMTITYTQHGISDYRYYICGCIMFLRYGPRPARWPSS